MLRSVSVLTRTVWTVWTVWNVRHVVTTLRSPARPVLGGEEHRAQWTSDVLLLYTPPLYHRHSQFVKVKPERDDSHVGGGGRDLLCGAEQAGSH